MHRVFKKPQILSGTREKNRSKDSLTPSDQQSEDSSEAQDEKRGISSATHSQTDERNRFCREQAVAQVRK